MIYAEEGKERDCFIAFTEYALGILSKEDYASFLALFDCGMTEQDLLLCLRYLDESRPVLKIDDPALVKSNDQRIDLFAFRDGSGYHLDYDLTTDGEINDLTIQVVFQKKENGYMAMLHDLHTL